MSKDYQRIDIKGLSKDWEQQNYKQAKCPKPEWLNYGMTTLETIKQLLDFCYWRLLDF